jgi:hypothetical protein
MTPLEQAAASDRLWRALLAFRVAQAALVVADQELEGLPAAEPKGRAARRMVRALHAPLERHLRIAATEVVAAFAAYFATGQIAPAEDRRLFTEAARIYAEAMV